MGVAGLRSSDPGNPPESSGQAGGGSTTQTPGRESGLHSEGHGQGRGRCWVLSAPDLGEPDGGSREVGTLPELGR